MYSDANPETRLGLETIKGVPPAARYRSLVGMKRLSGGCRLPEYGASIVVV
jgi:hypothetical protein